MTFLQVATLSLALGVASQAIASDATTTSQTADEAQQNTQTNEEANKAPASN